MRLRDRLACTTSKYDALYARWLQNPGALLDFGAFKPHERLLDLCGGTGAVSRAAWDRGARRITLLDLNPRCPLQAIRQVRGRAEELILKVGGSAFFGSFDLVVCRQALGYLNLEKVFGQVAWALSPKGRFVFNSFAKPRWKLDRYQYEGREYVEASGHLFGRVFHLQASPEVGVDGSLFRWHSEATIRQHLAPWFNVEVTRSARALHWLCKRPP